MKLRVSSARVLLVFSVLLCTLSPFSAGAISTQVPRSPMSVAPALSVSPIVDSTLAAELNRLQSSPATTGDQGVRALLRFSHELSASELSAMRSLGIRPEMRNGNVVHVGSIYVVRVTSKSSLTGLGQMGLTGAYSGDRRFVPSLESSVPAIGAIDVHNSLSVDGESVDGSGVTVAVLDTGVQWLHPSFWRVTQGPINVLQQGSEFYADLDNDSIADDDEGPIQVVEVAHNGVIETENEYLYIDTRGNSRFDYAEGDRWLVGVDHDHNGVISLPDEDVMLLGEPKVSILFDQFADNVYVRGVNLTTDALFVGDSNGHGTHVASIVAAGQPGYTSMIGVAPGADLMVIRSPLMSADIIEAVYFAIENGADVINMSFSSFLGFLDGTDIEDAAVSEALRKYGVLTTVATGNLAGTQKHARLAVNAGETASVSFAVNNPDEYSFFNALWYSDDSDEQIYLRTPSGRQIEIGTFSEIVGMSSELDEDEIHAYVFADRSVRGTNRLIVQLPSQQPEWQNGDWSLVVSNPSGDDVVMDCYVWPGNWGLTNLRFLDHIDNSRTVSSPGTADLGIAVGSVDDSLNSVSSSSGRGPRVDGAVRPIVVAPGVAITAARNSLTSLWTIKSGTSMASPHVAGLLALVLQASSSADSWEAYSAIVEGAGGLDGSHYDEPPRPDMGYGAVSAIASVRHVMPVPWGPDVDISDWLGVNPVYGPAENNGLPEDIDIVNVRVFSSLQEAHFAITMRGAPDITGGTITTLAVDRDSSSSTGDNGVDLLINVTGGSASVYEWDGSSFVASSLNAFVRNSSNTLFVRLLTSLAPSFTFEVSVESTTGPESDSSGSLVISDIWRPLVCSLSSNLGDDGVWHTQFTAVDLDTPSTGMAYSYHVYSGSTEDGTPLLSGGSTGDANVAIDIDLTTVNHSFDPVIVIDVTDGHSQFTLPPLLLSQATSPHIAIVSAVLGADTVAVGPLIDEMITASITVEGWAYVDHVYVSFRLSSEAVWNISASRTVEDGVYGLTLSTGSMPVGDYETYAVVVTIFGDTIEEPMGVLHLVSDYSRVIVPAGAVFAVTVTIVLWRTKRAARREV